MSVELDEMVPASEIRANDIIDLDGIRFAVVSVHRQPDTLLRFDLDALPEPDAPPAWYIKWDVFARDARVHRVGHLTVQA